MASCTIGLAEEEVFAARLGFGRFRPIEPAKNVQFRGRRKIQKLLELRHVMHLRAAVKNIQALLGGEDRVAVEVSGALLELSEIFNRLERSLRTKQALNVNAAERWRLNPPSVFLRTSVSHQMKCSGRMTVDVAIEAGDTPHTVGLLRLAICCS